MNTEKRVLLVGSGNIGRRHLQAMMVIPGDQKIEFEVVEPDQKARLLTQNVVNDAYDEPERSARARNVTVLENLNHASSRFDLAVIATNSRPRRAVFEELENKHVVESYIFEKVLFTNSVDLKEVGDRLAKSAKPAFVNCARRLFLSYQSLKQELDGKSEIVMEVRGSKYGLASNGIHFIDLFTYLTGNNLMSVSNADLEDGAYESRRSGYQEVFGTLECTFDGNCKLRLHCNREGDDPVLIRINSPDKDYEIRENEQIMTAIMPTSRDETSFKIPYISNIPNAYMDLLHGQWCDLTPYSLSAQHHMHYINAIRDHLGLSIEEDEPCPIS